jgi:hypothetical protein
MKFKYLTPILLMLAAACSQMPKNAEKPITIKVEKKRTEEEVLSIKPEKDDYKTWIFEQPVKVRVSASPSSKINFAIDEGAKVVASIFSLGNGWSRIILKDGTEGFFFGKTIARELPK